MTGSLLFLLIISALSLAQQGFGDDFDGEPFDWVKFSKNTENEYDDEPKSLEDVSLEENWDVERPLDVGDRNAYDYDTRDAIYEETCEVVSQPVYLDPSYEYASHLKFNRTCQRAPKNYKQYSRQDRVNLCVLKHQRIGGNNLCRTKTIQVPVYKKKIGSHEGTLEKQVFGIGCECYRPVAPWAFRVKTLL